MSNFKSIKRDRSESLFGEVIFSYTRAQAIADRALIDVTPTRRGDGFPVPYGRSRRPDGRNRDHTAAILA